MSQRVVRINEMLRREINQILRQRYQTSATAITISEVNVSANLRHARVYYSVLGDEQQAQQARNLLQRKGESIRREVGSVIVLKYLPHLEFIEDDSIQRGMEINQLMDDMGLIGEKPEPPQAPPSHSD